MSMGHGERICNEVTSNVKSKSNHKLLFQLLLGVFLPFPRFLFSKLEGQLALILKTISGAFLIILLNLPMLILFSGYFDEHFTLLHSASLTRDLLYSFQLPHHR